MKSEHLRVILSKAPFVILSAAKDLVSIRQPS